MLYIHRKDQPPKLDSSSAISILISSDFLQMNNLVVTCLDFLHSHINEIVKLPIDLNCLNNNLLGKLAALFTLDELNLVRDRRNKLIGKLYMKKLESMLEREENTLCKCEYCGKLFPVSKHEVLSCDKSKIYIDFHGNAIARHKPSENWNLNKHVQSLRSDSNKPMTWKEIYFKMWGLLNVLKCEVCGKCFQVTEINHCAYHPKPAHILSGDNAGYFPCCGAQALKFDTATEIRNDGCASRRHKIADESPVPNDDVSQPNETKEGVENSRTQNILQVLEKYESLITVDFKPVKQEKKEKNSIRKISINSFSPVPSQTSSKAHWEESSRGAQRKMNPFEASRQDAFEIPIASCI
eukprot:g3818.t1